MEVHAVLPEERARDEHGNILPWGYRYLQSAPVNPEPDSDPADLNLRSPSRNPRPTPEESGPFGKNPTARYTGSRNSRTRTGTTPSRQKENPTVAEFGRLFAKEQKQEERQLKSTITSTTSGDAPHPQSAPEAVATECILYGYASKASEWKILSKFESIVAPSYICEDYPRDDPNLSLASPDIFSKSLVVHRELTKDALRKSRVYRGGNHWIKITFNSHQAAERACHFSPQEIEGHLVFCEMWQGRAPFSDAPLIKGSQSANEHLRNANTNLHSLTKTEATSLRPSSFDSAVAGFERAAKTLPRFFTSQDLQYGKPQPQPSNTTPRDKDDNSNHTPSPESQSSTTASSATATGPDINHPTSTPTPSSSAVRFRSTANLATAMATATTTATSKHSPTPSSSEYMTAIPTVRKATLRPISEALLPQPSLSQRILRHVPILSWFVASTSKVAGSGAGGSSTTIIGDGPVLTEDGKWDEGQNGWYWCFWWLVDRWVGTDFCGLVDD